MSARMLTQVLPIQVRELEPRQCPDGTKKRRFAFVGATENGVRTPWGAEHLRMSGAKLDRYNANPVVLDAHNRSSALHVVARADVRIDGRTLVFDGVEFANTAKAREIEGLVADGFLRACSIGFMPDPKAIRTLETEADRDGDGADQVKGPATVIKEWELLELSMVPVGADEDALRREFYTEAKAMAEPEKKPEQQPAAAATPTTETRVAPAPTPPAPNAIAPATRAEIEAIVPRGLEAVGERCLIEGLTLATARTVLLAEHTKRHAPVGTPEPPEDKFKTPTGAGVPAGMQAPPLTVNEFKRAFGL